MMQIWLLLNSLGIAVLAVLQFLIIRQIGIMLSRLGPIGARSADDDGPRENENIGTQLAPIRSQLASGTAGVLYLFASRACSICREIRASAQKLAPLWQHDVQLVMVYDDAPEEDVSDREEIFPVIYHGRALRDSLDVNSVPFGIRVDSGDWVLGKGLVNTISHIESLLELKDMQSQDESEPAEMNLQLSDVV